MPRPTRDAAPEPTPDFQPPVRSAKLADQLYEQVLAKIVSGEFAEGDKLPSETRLGGLFGVSRPVVREALSRLQADGLVAARHGAGSFVRHRPRTEFQSVAPIGSIADLMRCFEFRVALEGEAAVLAAERHTAAELAAIEEALAALDRVIETGALGAEEDNAFHIAVARAAQNDLFTAALESLGRHVLNGIHVARILSLAHNRSRLRLVQNEHVAIVEAIRRRDPDGARNAMRRHIENARLRVLGRGEPAPDNTFS
ncbi:MAG TPA: FadR/GntR family transcriptional regulator [Inquilinus sp.]|nr:FadR/GntR family transcriptional regulator [Inquilinus sp.]